MINIAKKRLPRAAMLVLVYLSYCAMSWFVMRGSMAFYGERYGWAGWFANDIWAFFLGGLVPFAIYELFYMMTFRTLSVGLGGDDIVSVRYGLDLAVITANILLFALKFMYIAIPMYATVVNAIIDPVVTLAIVALYLLYVFKMDYVAKPHFRVVLMRIFGTYLCVYALLAVINLLMAAV